MHVLDECLAANRSWAAAMKGSDPSYFARLVGQQRPELLWLGCSDSRLMPTDMLGRRPGELFVHRNIANLFVPGDVNAGAVLEYAVEVLGVRHVIVCGHYGCGGVRATLEGGLRGDVGAWLRPVRDLYTRERRALDALSPQEREDRLCELNVAAQVANVCASPAMRDAWARGHAVAVHAWIYALTDGLLRDLDFSFEYGQRVASRRTGVDRSTATTVSGR